MLVAGAFSANFTLKNSSSTTTTTALVANGNFSSMNIGVDNLLEKFSAIRSDNTDINFSFIQVDNGVSINIVAKSVILQDTKDGISGSAFCCNHNGTISITADYFVINGNITTDLD